MEFLFLATAHFLALLSPGPDFFLILQASLRLPLRCGIAVCGGIAAANGVYLLCAILGLEILKDLAWLMEILRYLGAGYLLFLGFMLLKAPFQSLAQPGSENFIGSHNMPRQFFIGFTSGILNPKNAVFYLSLFTVLVSPQTPLVFRSLYGLWMTLVVFFWDCLVILVIGREKVKKRLGRGIFYLEKVAGIMLSAFGLMLPFT